jgi:hypothetical protein
MRAAMIYALAGALLGAGIAGGITVAVATSDSGVPVISACADSRSGAMRLLTSGACKKGEQLVVWNQQGIPGPGSGPIVVDGNGTTVGSLVKDPLVGFGNPWVVVHTEYGDRALLRDGKAVSIAPTGGPVYFPTPDCSGSPIAVGYPYDLDDWYDVPRVWPATGDRKSYRIDPSYEMFTAHSQAGGWVEEDGGRSWPNDGCLVVTEPVYGFQVIEDPTAVVVDVPGPLTIRGR